MREVKDTAKVISKSQKVNISGYTSNKIGHKYNIKQKNLT